MKIHPVAMALTPTMAASASATSMPASPSFRQSIRNRTGHDGVNDAGRYIAWLEDELSKFLDAPHVKLSAEQALARGVRRWWTDEEAREDGFDADPLGLAEGERQR